MSKLEKRYMLNENKYRFLIRRIHTLGLDRNGAAIVLLASFIPKTGESLQFLHDNRGYFTPFVLGLLFAGAGAVFGEILENIDAHDKHHKKIVNDTNKAIDAGNRQKATIVNNIKSQGLTRGNALASRVYYEVMRAAIASALILFCIGLYSLIYVAPE